MALTTITGPSLGNLTGTLTTTGDFTVNSTKFTVAANTGNANLSGILSVGANVLAVFSNYGGINNNGVDANSSTYITVSNQNNGNNASAGIALGAYGYSWVIDVGSTAKNSNDLTFRSDISSPVSRMALSTGGVLTIYNALYGKTYPQTSSSSGTSIIDTGITATSIAADGALYFATAIGDPNAGGSSSYSYALSGIITVYTGYDGANVRKNVVITGLSGTGGGGTLTWSVCWWNGSSELTWSTAGTDQIRVKVSGYNTSYVGYNQTVRLLRIA